MTTAQPAPISANHHAQVLVRCPDLNASIAFFTEQLGMAVDRIHPADSPREAVLSGHGVSLCLRVDGNDSPHNPTLRLICDAHTLPSETARVLISPCGVRVELCDAVPALHIPQGEQAFILTRHDARDGWHVGRAGMHYRDLIPGRLGGRFIASHIRIPDGGAVPDYVHYHRVRFQMIFCKAGWVRVVYEDQGEPFVLHAGDCVLQPPQIRHRVLEASPGLEVIELGCPAVHETLADRVLALPNTRHLPQREFSGQRFVRHVAADAAWQPWRAPGFSARDTGIADATGGLAGARVLRCANAPASASPQAPLRHHGELLFLFVLGGSLELHSTGHGTHTLGINDSCVIPADTDFLLHAGNDMEVLEVSLPACSPG